MKEYKAYKFQAGRLLYVMLDYILTAAVIGFTYFFNMKLRGISQPDDALAIILFTFLFPLLMIVAFLFTGVYRVLYREFGLFEAMRISIVVASVDVVGFGVLIIFRYAGITDSMSLWTWALICILLFLGLPASRIVARLYRLALGRTAVKDAIKTIIIGAGDMGKFALDDSRNNPLNKNKIVAFVDDDPNKIGKFFEGVKIYGPIANVQQIIEKMDAKEVIICIGYADKERIREIIASIGEAQVRIKRMPLLSEMNGPNDKKITEVNLDELLCREPIKLNNHGITNMIHDSCVLVTGAGGSIGSELTRQIFAKKPKTLVLFDIYENGVYDIQMELFRKMREEGNISVDVITLIGSTYNEERMEQVISRYKPDYIYHAAAYKHVPLMEDSPAEAIRANVVGTYNVARLADKYGVKKMVLVSTDKAVRPTNTMGATKRFAETIIQYWSEKSKNTNYAAVRFGNVLGSNGSVVPLFKKQIECGGPVTITHKDIIRYFMTIPEAVSLILQCSLFAKGGEIFILDMGKPVKIMTLAEKMIRQAGLVPGVDIKIIETGLRPGEKLYEELLLDKEKQTHTENEKIFIEPKEDIYPVEENMKKIVEAFHLDSNDDVKKLLASIIDTYQYKK